MQSVKHNKEVNIEAMDVPPPPIHFNEPAAIVHKVDAPVTNFKSFYNASFMPSPDFINYIKSVEK